MKKFLLAITLLSLGLFSQLHAQDYLFPAKKYGIWGYIDSQGKWILEPDFRDAREFTEGLAAVKISDKWGFIDHNGDWMITAQFENAIPFSEGLAAVVHQNRWGFIDRVGKFIVEPQFQKVSSFSEGLALVSNGNGYFFISQEGKFIGENNFLTALPFAEGMAPFVSYDQKGYIDNNGVVTIKHSFSKAAPFSEGLAQVSSNNRWGFIDRSGNVSIPLVFESSGHFSSGLAAVRKGKKWGFINKQGEWIIDAEYDLAMPFYHGFAVVKHKDEYGIIDPSGDWVLKPKFQKIRKAGKTVSLKEQLKKMIQDHFVAWSAKGEFEKTESYIIRMEDKSRKKAMDSISQKVINMYGSGIIDLQNSELGYYNADLEQFNIYIAGALPTMIQVPIAEALWFKENYRNGNFTETDFMLAGESLIISNYLYNLQGRFYAFDISSTQGFLYNYASIAWEEEIIVPEVSWGIKSDSESSTIVAKAGSADVDKNIPVRQPHNKNTFALIIGNEDYASFQAGLFNEIDVSFAATDAEIFSKYVNLTLGVPEKNITLITNGTAGQINQALAKMSSIAEAYKGEAEFIFYYAGHGLPDETTGKPYLIPVDVSGADLSFAISLDGALNRLTENPHTRVTVFLDACFTGGGRNDGIIASRGVKIKPKSPFIKGNLVLFSASSGTQSAFAYYEKAHGMFTYFLLKKLQDSKGTVTYFELDQYLKENVRKSAIVYNSKEQNPELMVSPSFEDSWRGFRLDTPFQLTTNNKILKP